MDWFTVLGCDFERSTATQFDHATHGAVGTVRVYGTGWYAARSRAEREEDSVSRRQSKRTVGRVFFWGRSLVAISEESRLSSQVE